MKALSQGKRLYRLLSDGKPHSTPEIQQVVYGADHLGTARIASRVTDLRNAGHVVDSWKDADNPSIWHYQLNYAVPIKHKLVAVRTPNGVAMMTEAEAIRLKAVRV